MQHSFSFDHLAVGCQIFLNAPDEDLANKLNDRVTKNFINKLATDLDTAIDQIVDDNAHDYSFYSDLDRSVKEMSSKIIRLKKFDPTNAYLASLEDSLDQFKADLFRKRVELREVRSKEIDKNINDIVSKGRVGNDNIMALSVIADGFATGDVRDREDLQKLKNALSASRDNVSELGQEQITNCISSIDNILYKRAHEKVLNFKNNDFHSQAEIDEWRSSFKTVMENTSDKDKFEALQRPVVGLRDALERTKAMRKGLVVEPFQEEVQRFFSMSKQVSSRPESPKGK